MSRSLKKGPYIDPRVQKKVDKILETNGKKYFKTWARASQISPEMVGFTMEVHNGKDFIPVFITESMIGHRLGEFSLTRKFNGHSKKGKIAKATGSSGSLAK
ncbi:30S ribosomal protein S19 [bacterium]|nr:MAG: 30S ribosomal protein S19 [bacterium]